MKSLFVLFAILLVSCSPVVKEKVSREFREAGADCTHPNECESGVCDHYKADLGKCASVECVPGTLADNNNVYCGKTNKWQSTKLEGESCEESYECFKQTCFMIPDCTLTDIPNTVVSCENNQCSSRIEKAECEQQGLKTVLAKHEFMSTDDGSCVESLAQRELSTVCAPCGNGVCDEVESKCNCPLDCT